MIKFLLFPHSLHKRLSNLLNCICMLIEMNQLSGLCGTAAVYGHLLLWLCLMPWGQQKALVATGLHSPCPSVHLQPPACRQWPCLCFREGRRRAGSHDLLADEGRFPGRSTRRGGTGREESDRTGGHCSHGGQMEGRSWWGCECASWWILQCCCGFLDAWKQFLLQRASCRFQGGWSVVTGQPPV